jgi:glycosyltransferase involved in cell wall biosynthesis
LDAFAKLSEFVPNLHLVLVGDGPARAHLEKRAPKGVHFLGWRDDIPEILRASDIFVLPSLKEAFGMVVLEAMASGVPVIATASGGVPDIIEDGRTGYLVPPADSSAIHDAILNILRNPQQKADITKAALKRVAEHFNARRMAKETIQAYAHAIKPPSL